ncbi:hypothetical protein ACWY4P_53835 (plasmid) [Streptomyces sp. LZ34]
MTPQHTGATPTDLTTWGAADLETSENLTAVQHIDNLPDAGTQRNLARCAGHWAAATTLRLAQRSQRDQARRQRTARRALRAHRLAA